ncbi:MAG: Crp/Fnr family transcriptional regulator [Sporocytophaga sp.]|uniref:Crp/Fnr family transcriptional regulator n=1 Tax=Sporocytophaga sp. TaxID=2231183 RepID=UPI001B290367|nr:Crp/Fnr family transcriptional regulator [Sporocytophaga sp.]MBO9698962.1 Crp/Fnr family transcriptional regulator [Sporocytophaga sp.]
MKGNPNNSDSLKKIKSFLSLVASSTAEETDYFLKLLKPVRVNKGEYFISEGQIPRKFAFINEGLFRYLYIDKTGKEFTKNFLTEGKFIVSYSAMIAQKPSLLYIEALEDSDIFEIDYAQWLEVKKRHECWSVLLIAMLEHAFVTKEKRERDLLLLDARERYMDFLNEFPTLENRVKQHMIASYLGISPISLSRIRKNENH